MFGGTILSLAGDPSGDAGHAEICCGVRDGWVAKASQGDLSLSSSQEASPGAEYDRY